jgi:hypothetical protein
MFMLAAVSLDHPQEGCEHDLAIRDRQPNFLSSIVHLVAEHPRQSACSTFLGRTGRGDRLDDFIPRRYWP